MPIPVNRGENAAQAMAQALTAEGSAEDRQSAISEAWNMTMSQIADSVREDFEASQHAADVAILAQRGYRQLTSKENRFYEVLTAALRSEAPTQMFADFIGEDGEFMPETIIEDVFKGLEDDHELLQVIEFSYTGYKTKWIRNKRSAAMAVWGTITGAITEEIKQSLQLMSIDQGKLTAFAVLPLDILDMGYQFVDQYVRRCLTEALYDGLEDGIVNGTGINDQPVGLIRDIHHGVSISSTTGYPAKTPVALTGFTGDVYLPVVAPMAKTESWTEGSGDAAKTYGGKKRSLPEVIFICNTNTWITKVKPAQQLLTNNGYAEQVVSYNTHFVQCEAVADNRAIMLAPKGYTFCVGGSRNGGIEFDDSFKFLEDARTFKIVQHGDGIADDNTAVVYVNVENMEALSLPVAVTNTVKTTTVTA